MLSQFKKLTPLLNRVVVKRLESTKKSAGGVYLPESSDRDLRIGEVISVGEGSYDDNGNFRQVSVKPGQKVLLPDYGGSSVEFHDQKLSIYKDSEILAVLE